MRRSGLPIPATLCLTLLLDPALAAAPSDARSPPAQPIPIAVIDFDYRDSSGEVQDLTAEHRERLKAFMSSLRSDLAASAGYRLVDVSCGTEPCSMATATPSDLVGEAKRAGARLLLYGGIHKKSTLVQWAKVQVVDIEADKLLVDRWLSFRGDSDEAWRRAEAFIVEDLKDGLRPR